jgi:hypothetical protein
MCALWDLDPGNSGARDPVRRRDVLFGGLFKQWECLI